MRCAASTQSSERFPLFPVLSVGTGFSTRRFVGCFYAPVAQRVEQQPMRGGVSMVQIHPGAPHAVPRHGNSLTHEPTTHPDGRSGAGFTSGSGLSSPLCKHGSTGNPEPSPTFILGGMCVNKADVVTRGHSMTARAQFGACLGCNITGWFESKSGFCTPVAQVVEHRSPKPDVAGSTPAGSARQCAGKWAQAQRIAEHPAAKVPGAAALSREAWHRRALFQIVRTYV